MGCYKARHKLQPQSSNAVISPYVELIMLHDKHHALHHPGIVVVVVVGYLLSAASENKFCFFLFFFLIFEDLLIVRVFVCLCVSFHPHISLHVFFFVVVVLSSPVVCDVCVCSLCSWSSSIRQRKTWSSGQSARASERKRSDLPGSPSRNKRTWSWPSHSASLNSPEALLSPPPRPPPPPPPPAPPLPPLAPARHGTAQPGPAQKAPKQSGDCIGLIQQHLLTPWRDFLRINPPLNLSTPSSPLTAHWRCGILRFFHPVGLCGFISEERTDVECTRQGMDCWMKCSEYGLTLRLCSLFISAPGYKCHFNVCRM